MLSSVLSSTELSICSYKTGLFSEIFVVIFVIDQQSILSRKDTVIKLETYWALERLLHAYLSSEVTAIKFSDIHIGTKLRHFIGR